MTAIRNTLCNIGDNIVRPATPALDMYKQFKRFQWFVAHRAMAPHSQDQPKNMHHRPQTVAAQIQDHATGAVPSRLDDLEDTNIQLVKAMFVCTKHDTQLIHVRSTLAGTSKDELQAVHPSPPLGVSKHPNGIAENARRPDADSRSHATQRARMRIRQADLLQQRAVRTCHAIGKQLVGQGRTLPYSLSHAAAVLA